MSEEWSPTEGGSRQAISGLAMVSQARFGWERR